jgi:hypothetical protein
MPTAANTTEKDIFSRDFTVGSYVMVRCQVTAITPAPPAGNPLIVFFGGSGDSVSLLVETPNPQDKAGVSFVVSPTQIRSAGPTA